MKTIKKRVIILSIFVLLISNVSYAQFAVIDAAGLGQAITQVAQGYQQIKNMIEQIQTAKAELENSMKNLMAQGAYFYNLPNTIKDEIEELDKQLRYLTDLESTLGKFQDIDYYKSSPCFSAQGCTEEEMNEILYKNEDNVMSLSDAAKVSLRISEHYNTHSLEKELSDIRSRTKAAEGQLAATQNVAEYMDITNQNIIALRQEIRGINQVLAQQALNEAEKEKIQETIPFNTEFQQTEKFEIQTFD